MDPFAVEECRDLGVGVGFRHVVGDVEGTAVQCVGVSGVGNVTAALHDAEAGEKGGVAHVVDDLVRTEELRVQEGGVPSTGADEVLAAFARS